MKNIFELLKKGNLLISKNFKWYSIFAGILGIIAGMYMLTRPASSLASMAIFFAIVFLFDGIAEIVKYFSKEKELRTGWELFHGLITVLLALSLFSSSLFNLAMFIPYISTIWVLFAGISRTMLSFTFRKMDKKIGNLMLTLGILGLIAGAVMLSHPIMTGLFVAYTIGFIFIYNGVSAIIFALKK